MGTATKQPAAAGAARTSKGTAADIAASEQTAEQQAQARKDAAKAKRTAKREAYPVVIVRLKLHKNAQSRDVLEKMFETTMAWAEPNKYVVSLFDPTTQKSGAEVHEIVIDTPESFAAKTKVRGDADKTREISKAIATALRSDVVLAKAVELNVAPKDLVLTALQSQFGITIEL